MARFGRISERFDLGVLVSPVLLAERQTWTTPLFRSTWSQVSLRSSPGRRPSVIDSDEERFEPKVVILGVIDADLRAA